MAGMMVDTVVGRGEAVWYGEGSVTQEKGELGFHPISATNVLYDTENKLLHFFNSHMCRAGTGQEIFCLGTV